ncbi:hypothetical protein [Dyadobacter alkalitolerans]|uniref:hypothetical protein n=1 Tax=Dyadobacter alkalitolerans TaxID=492736 RepID=UPI0003F52425|nr:hypothetical protein [Dyadobacter alkalitolerans]
MKTRARKLLILSMFLTFFLYDCRNKDAESLGPGETALSKELEALEMNEVKLEETADIRATPGKIEATAKAKALNESLGKVNSTDIPANVLAAVSEISTSLSAAEIKTLKDIKPSKNTLNSTEVKRILAKAGNDAAMKPYLSLLTAAKIDGLSNREDSGKPAKLNGGSQVVGNLESSDECVVKAREKFEKTVGKLDEHKAKALGKIDEVYLKDLEKIQQKLEKCLDENNPEHFEKLRQAGIKFAEQSLSALEKAKPYLNPAHYDNLKALINIQLFDYLNNVNKLEAAKNLSCTKVADLAKAEAAKVKAVNTAKVASSYSEALGKAEELLAKMIANCHNQGSGN